MFAGLLKKHLNQYWRNLVEGDGHVTGQNSLNADADPDPRLDTGCFQIRHIYPLIDYQFCPDSVRCLKKNTSVSCYYYKCIFSSALWGSVMVQWSGFESQCLPQFCLCGVSMFPFPFSSSKLVRMDQMLRKTLATEFCFNLEINKKDILLEQDKFCPGLFGLGGGMSALRVLPNL